MSRKHLSAFQNVITSRQVFRSKKIFLEYFVDVLKQFTKQIYFCWIDKIIQKYIKHMFGRTIKNIWYTLTKIDTKNEILECYDTRITYHLHAEKRSVKFTGSSVLIWTT